MKRNFPARGALAFLLLLPIGQAGAAAALQTVPCVIDGTTYQCEIGENSTGAIAPGHVIVDANGADATGAGGSGIAQPGGGSGILGWLSGIDALLAGTLSFAQVPTAANAQAIAPVVSASSSVSSLIIKTSQGNLYGVTAIPSVAGWLMVLNAAAPPSNGAVSPLACAPTGANQLVQINFPIPQAYSNGITAVYSTTGCNILTLSASAWMSGSAR